MVFAFFSCPFDIPRHKLLSLLGIIKVTMLECEAFTCSNDHANLKHHRNSLRGTVVDFIITFKDEETSVDIITKITCDLFEELCKSFNGKRLKGDLCAKVRYLRVSTGKVDSYFHASSPSDDVNNPAEFFKEHLLRIASRIDKMNQLGSMLLILAIDEIHIRLGLLN